MLPLHVLNLKEQATSEVKEEVWCPTQRIAATSNACVNKRFLEVTMPRQFGGYHGNAGGRTSFLSRSASLRW